jgi:hypothetical protein
VTAKGRRLGGGVHSVYYRQYYDAKGRGRPAYLPVYLPTYLPACLPAYLPAYHPAYLPSYSEAIRGTL